MDDASSTSSYTEGKPIFMATHPRACSTAFERVMMTRKDVLTCVHEPFGEPFYYSHDERLGSRYGADTDAMRRVREETGYAKVTYKDVFDDIDRQAAETGKRVFIKDIAHYLIPPVSYKERVQIAPSLVDDDDKDGIKNPTVVPLSRLRDFHFTFLIRHPKRSIPSYYRCTRPPLSELTGFHHFLAEEAGYRELRAVFDYLRATGVVTEENMFVLDADDLLENPEEAIRRYCGNVGIEFRPEMLSWDKGKGCEAFEKWKGFHEDAIGSDGLKKREKRTREKTEEQNLAEWTEKWGADAAELIRKTVEETKEDYEYLRGFKEVF
ncbi:hypothetical protein K440DRAFT_648670 [Wilcoxina mikolae CBS 423.85]|nr:hypothetical protein K440DRAFT_648670 [Wilcoxina mikolae CBS 423.85]